jgi:hypothetical protein
MVAGDLGGVVEHGMSGEGKHRRTWDILIVLTPEGKYWPTSVKARELKRRLGSQMGRSTKEVG